MRYRNIIVGFSLWVGAGLLLTQTAHAHSNTVLVCNTLVYQFRIVETHGALFGKGSGLGEVRVRPHSPLKIDKPVVFQVRNVLSKVAIVLNSKTAIGERRFYLAVNPTSDQNPNTYSGTINYFGPTLKATCRLN